MNGTCLQLVTRRQGVSLYNLPSSRLSEVIIGTTPGIARILNRPEICGSEFQASFSDALVRILRCIFDSNSTEFAAAAHEVPIDVLYILRGGLNYNLHEVVSKVTRRYPEVSFVSSQRINAEARFDIAESDYEKWSIQDNAVLCLGDICATGTTLTAALDRTLARYSYESKSPRWLFLITVGTSQALSALSQYTPAYAATKGWSSLRGITVVFLGQIFHLYEGNSLLEFNHLPFTDFFRRDNPAALEFERTSLMNPFCYLERCAIYDGGSRAFEPHTYLENLRTYWLAMQARAQNVNTMQLLSLKSSFLDYRLSFDDWLQKRPWWANIETRALRGMHQMGEQALHEVLAAKFEEICDERLAQIETKVREIDGQLH